MQLSAVRCRVGTHSNRTVLQPLNSAPLTARVAAITNGANLATALETSVHHQLTVGSCDEYLQRRWNRIALKRTDKSRTVTCSRQIRVQT